VSIATEHEALEEYLAGPEPTAVTPDLDEEQVDRELGRLAGLRRQADDAREVAEARTASINAWLEDRLETLAARATTIEQRLELYHRARLEKDPKALTVSLPSGTLVSKAQEPEWLVTDEKALIEWADEHAPDVVRRKPAPDAEVDRNNMKRELVKRQGRKIVARGIDPNTGEKAPGLEVVARDRSFRADTSDVE
jgi:phage host-nuclease inhibitor protein Gam